MYEKICSNSTDKVFETNEIVFSADSKLLYIAGQRLDKIKKEWGQVEVMDVDSLELLSERNRDSDDWMTSCAPVTKAPCKTLTRQPAPTLELESSDAQALKRSSGVARY